MVVHRLFVAERRHVEVVGIRLFIMGNRARNLSCEVGVEFALVRSVLRMDGFLLLLLGGDFNFWFSFFLSSFAGGVGVILDGAVVPVFLGVFNDSLLFLGCGFSWFSLGVMKALSVYAKAEYLTDCSRNACIDFSSARALGTSFHSCSPTSKARKRPPLL